MLKKVKILVVTIFLGNAIAFSQLTTSTSMTPTQLVEDVLVGSGVAVSNVSYTGHAEAIGSFNGSSTNLGLSSGIVLTTGTVLNSGGLFGGNGPHGPNDSGSAGTDNGQPGYGSLTSLAGANTYNAAILQFDFVPQSDSVRFKYVFGSDEYPEFVDGGFNDAFAFYISGPGFGGTYNMAQIPGGGGVVSIDNINNGTSNAGPCQNCSYYINNGTGSNSPYNSSSFYIQYDGFTVVLEAAAEVQCGETYHLVIAIADAGDGAYDSGIFLEANSLASYAPVEIAADLATDAYANNFGMAEGCETATITVTRSNAMASTAQVIPVIVSGSATEGVDYSNVPATINFAAGQTTATFSIDIFSDLIAEGDETVIIQLDQPDPCGNSNYITLNLVIKNTAPLQVSVPSQTVHCPGEDVNLNATVTGGLPPFTYSWNSGETTEDILVAPTATTSYTLTVIDACLEIPASGSGTITVPVYPPINIVTSPDTSVLCPNTPLVLFAEATGGEGTFTYTWTEGSTTIGSGFSVNVSPMVTTTYTVLIEDGCGSPTQSNVTVTVIASVLELAMSPDQLICPGDTANIFVVASEGLGNYTYYWHHSGETTSSVLVSPNYTHNYVVSVEDDCHTYHIDGFTTVEVVRPHANFAVLTSEPMVDLPVSFQNLTSGGVSWWWDLDNGETSTINSPTTTYGHWGWYEVTLVAYNEIGCTDTVQKMVYIKPEFYFYAPNAFTPNADRFNNTYSVSVVGATEFSFQIFDRWGQLVYETSDMYFKWDGLYKNQIPFDAVFVYKARVVDRELIPHEFTGHITVLR
ncbi:MAG: choice-of-anchor L domain-containing protein [Crocinitomicaceae bacterium]|nr:choice-of-anchor L domain-containing protein [Crocinitomicaceae bacterium]